MSSTDTVEDMGDSNTTHTMFEVCNDDYFALIFEKEDFLILAIEFPLEVDHVTYAKELLRSPRRCVSEPTDFSLRNASPLVGCVRCVIDGVPVRPFSVSVDPPRCVHPP